MKEKGITLIALVITIIVLLILAGVTVATLTGDNGLLGKAGNAKIETEKAEIRETIELECISLEGDKNLKSKTDKEKLEILVERLKTRNGLEEQNTNYEISSKFASITTKQGFEYTVLFDYTVIEGKLAYLDIEDGSIQLKESGYIQGNNALVPYTGKYIITGNTKDNTVSILEKGTYDVTIKDLNIDVSTKNNVVAFLAGNINTGLNVTLNIEGNNTLISSSASALSWSGVTNETGGSKLEICGKGRLELSCGNSYGAMCIGGNNAKNLTITSGEIYAIKRGEKYGNPIGGNGASIIINRWDYSCKF